MGGGVSIPVPDAGADWVNEGLRKTLADHYHRLHALGLRDYQVQEQLDLALPGIAAYAQSMDRDGTVRAARLLDLAQRLPRNKPVPRSDARGCPLYEDLPPRVGPVATAQFQPYEEEAKALRFDGNGDDEDGVDLVAWLKALDARPALGAAVARAFDVRAGRVILHETAEERLVRLLDKKAAREEVCVTPEGISYHWAYDEFAASEEKRLRQACETTGGQHALAVFDALLPSAGYMDDNGYEVMDHRASRAEVAVVLRHLASLDALQGSEHPDLVFTAVTAAGAGCARDGAPADRAGSDRSAPPLAPTYGGSWKDARPACKAAVAAAAVEGGEEAKGVRPGGVGAVPGSEAPWTVAWVPGHEAAAAGAALAAAAAAEAEAVAAAARSKAAKASAGAVAATEWAAAQAAATATMSRTMAAAIAAAAGEPAGTGGAMTPTPETTAAAPDTTAEDTPPASSPPSVEEAAVAAATAVANGSGEGRFSPETVCEPKNRYDVLLDVHEFVFLLSVKLPRLWKNIIQVGIREEKMGRAEIDLLAEALAARTEYRREQGAR